VAIWVCHLLLQLPSQTVCSLPLLLLLQCVVAAELVSLAGDSGIKCGGAMLRDVGVYCIAVTSVLLAFSLGQVRSHARLQCSS